MNDFTCFSLAADRGIKQYSMQDEGVKRLVQDVISRVHSEGLPVSMAGYLNRSVVDSYEQSQFAAPDYYVVHYDAIPDMFDNLTEGKNYSKHYKDIKARYNSVKELAKEI